MSNQRVAWYELPAFRLVGHPVVFGIICVAFAATVISLGIALTRDSTTSLIVWRSFSVVVVGLGAATGWKAFQARRRRDRRSAR